MGARGGAKGEPGSPTSETFKILAAPTPAGTVASHTHTGPSHTHTLS